MLIDLRRDAVLWGRGWARLTSSELPYVSYQPLNGNKSVGAGACRADEGRGLYAASSCGLARTRSKFGRTCCRAHLSNQVGRGMERRRAR